MIYIQDAVRGRRLKSSVSDLEMFPGEETSRRAQKDLTRHKEVSWGSIQDLGVNNRGAKWWPQSHSGKPRELCGLALQSRVFNVPRAVWFSDSRVRPGFKSHPCYLLVVVRSLPLPLIHDPSLPTSWCDHSRVFPPLNSESRGRVTNWA